MCKVTETLFSLNKKRTRLSISGFLRIAIGGAIKLVRYTDPL